MAHTYWRSFKSAKSYVQSIGLSSAPQFFLWCAGKLPALPKKPDDIPSSPALVYANEGWISWGDFFGTGRRYYAARAWRSYDKASEFARNLGISSAQMWDDFCSGRLAGFSPRPSDIPADPSLAYRGCGWEGWPSFLGTAQPQARQTKAMRPYEAARAFVRALDLQTSTRYRAWCAGKLSEVPDRPADIPTNPQSTYLGRGWVSWEEFLGTAAPQPSSLLSATLDILLR